MGIVTSAVKSAVYLEWAFRSFGRSPIFELWREGGWEKART